MAWIIYIYVTVSLVIAVTAYNAAGWQPGLSAFGTTALVFWAGAGLRGSFFPGTKKIHKVQGVVLATIFLAVAHWLGKGFSVHFMDWDFTGTEWGWIGFVICFVCTTKRFGNLIPANNSGTHVGLMKRLRGASAGNDLIRLEILMDYSEPISLRQATTGTAAVRWSILDSSISQETLNFYRAALIALLYAEALVIQAETRPGLFSRVDAAATQYLVSTSPTSLTFDDWLLEVAGIAGMPGFAGTLWPWQIIEPSAYQQRLLSHPPAHGCPKTYTAILKRRWTEYALKTRWDLELYRNAHWSGTCVCTFGPVNSGLRLRPRR